MKSRNVLARQRLAAGVILPLEVRCAIKDRGDKDPCRGVNDIELEGDHAKRMWSKQDT